MKRRAMMGLCAAVLAAPLCGRASGTRKSVCYLSGGSDGGDIARALGPLGWVEGRNLRFEVRIAPDDDPGAADAAAAAVVRSAHDVLIGGLSIRTLALMRATRTIPIVCAGVGDPVASGLARTEARPGFNVTGLSNNVPVQMRMLVGLLRATMPRLERLVALRGPLHDAQASSWVRYEAILREERLQGRIELVRSTVDALAALSRCDRAREAAVQLLDRDHDQRAIAMRAIERGVALAALNQPEAVRYGALMSFGLEFADRPARIAAITDKLLRGAPPAETPFETADRPVFSVNRSTAAAIGLRIPDAVLLRVTEIVG